MTHTWYESYKAAILETDWTRMQAAERQETPLFAKSIERHALRNSSSARVASAA
jgi:hypothetical protein